MHDVPVFLGVAVLLAVTPGPDMALVTKNALRYGRREALTTAFGVELGLIAWTVASALGVGALLEASRVAYDVLRIAGAVYLAYLGIQAILASRRHEVPESRQTGRHAPRRWLAPFREGLFSNLLNPKIAVFFTSLLPQFVAPGQGAVLNSVLLGGVLVMVGLAWLSSYAVLASSAASVLRRPRVRVAMSRLTGVVLIAFGVRLATERP
jgi:RhtB (resistance to homoserine/threonine) family protein